MVALTATRLDEVGGVHGPRCGPRRGRWVLRSTVDRGGSGVRAALGAWPAAAAWCAWEAAPWPPAARWEWLRCRALRAAAKAWACSADYGEATARVGRGGVRLGRRDHVAAAARRRRELRRARVRRREGEGTRGWGQRVRRVFASLGKSSPSRKTRRRRDLDGFKARASGLRERDLVAARVLGTRAGGGRAL